MNPNIDLVASYAARGLIRVLVWPACALPECRLKQQVRRLVLRVQHSLPIELAVSRGQTAVQIGTPHPRTVRRFSRAAGPAGRVVVFEAEPHNFSRLKKSIEQERLRNVHLIAAAAWYENGEGELLISPYSGDHKVSLTPARIDNDERSGNERMEAIPCRFRRIDDVLSELGISHADYLSVTVNGAELEVLRGAEKTLRSSPTVRVYAKGHALCGVDGQPINVPIRAWLQSLGFATMKTRGERPATHGVGWQRRAGDVYGWKNTEYGPTKRVQ